jgi:hypothetical protein
MFVSDLSAKAKFQILRGKKIMKKRGPGKKSTKIKTAKLLECIEEPSYSDTPVSHEDDPGDLEPSDLAKIESPSFIRSSNHNGVRREEMEIKPYHDGKLKLTLLKKPSGNPFVLSSLGGPLSFPGLKNEVKKLQAA